MTRTLIVLIIVLALIGGAAALTSRPAFTLEQFANPDPDISLKASQWVTDNPLAAESLLLEGLKHPSPRVRAMCAHHLWMMRSTAAVPALVEALSDPQTAVRQQAALGLRWMRNWPDVQVILRMVGDRSQPDGVRKALLDGLGERVEPAARALCCRLALDKSESQDVREGAVCCLGHVAGGQRECFDTLVKIKRDGSADECLRLKAVAAVPQTHDSRSFEFLVATAQDGGEKVRERAAAARALGHLGDPRALPLLHAWLYNPQSPIVLRVKALLGLLELGEAVTPPPGLLMQALEDDAWYVRESAVMAIIRLEDVDMIPVLDQLSKQEKNSCVAGMMSSAVCHLRGVGEQEER